jgi:ABC-2 type transport system ATP-binding protein
MKVNLEAVSFSYRRRPRVLREVSWQLGQGVTGLLGPNGAGKTTLINLLVGISKPSSGSISVTRHEGPSLPVSRANMGFVPQRFSVAAEMTAFDTIAYTAWINGVSARACARRAATVLETVGLEDQARMRVRELSGGQRQRLGLATALSHDPDVLVLDEPTVGLDPGQRVRAREIIAQIGRSVPVLLSTHLIEDVQHLCDRVGVLAGGHLAFDGTVAELEALMAEDASDSSGLGSRFERSYQSLIERMGGGDD